MQGKAFCRKCGAPLKKGNIKVVRPRGKKRPYRICRACPDQVKTAAVPPVAQVAMFGDTAGPVQRPQGMTGGPVTIEGFLDYPPPVNYRFFMTRDQAERVKRSLEKPIYQGFGIGFEVIPVPDYQVDADLESFADLVEVTVDWKGDNHA